MHFLHWLKEEADVVFFLFVWNFFCRKIIQSFLNNRHLRWIVDRHISPEPVDVPALEHFRTVGAEKRHGYQEVELNMCIRRKIFQHAGDLEIGASIEVK